MAAKIPRDEEGVNPLERGRCLYQRKDYPGALEAFSDVGAFLSGLYAQCPSMIAARSLHGLKILCNSIFYLLTWPNKLKYTDQASQAIKVSSGSLLLTALDHRAASYEKLNKLQAALRDSREMIELNPDLAKV